MPDCILYILYYILAYIQHEGDVELENAVSLTSISLLTTPSFISSFVQFTGFHFVCISHLANACYTPYIFTLW